MTTSPTKAAELAEKLDAILNGPATTTTAEAAAIREAAALLRASEGRVPEGLPEGIAERLRRSIAWLDKGELLPGPGGCISLPDIKALHAMLTAAPHPPAQQAEPNASLRRFLDAAAGEGLVLDGVDAADLFNQLFDGVAPHKAEGAEPQKGGV